MSVISMYEWRVSRAAREMDEAMSNDPLVRAKTRIRHIARLMRLERSVSRREPAELVPVDALQQARERVRAQRELAGRRAARPRDKGDD